MLREELAMVDDTMMDEVTEDLTEEPGDKEEVLGEASEEIKRMWTYYVKAEEKSTRYSVDARYERKDADRRDELRRQSIQLRVKAGMVQQMTWVTMRDHFDVWDPGYGVAIRAGWLVTKFKADDNAIRDILRGMMGGS
jgi:hypothetical protein